MLIFRETQFAVVQDAPEGTLLLKEKKLKTFS